MNFLAHLYLSGPDDEILVGNFIGDFVKGRIGDCYPHRLRDGIVLHRRIDVFAEHHPLFRRSRERISPSYGLYRGVLVDLFYDHFLAAGWAKWSDESLAEYLARAKSRIDRYPSFIPVTMHDFVSVLFEELIPSYRQVEGIAVALERMSRRLRRQNPLHGAATELLRNYADLHDDFTRFLPEAEQFVAGYIAALR